MHVNGTAEPLATVSVPQGVYTAATATLGGTTFACESNPNTGVYGGSVVIYSLYGPISTIPVVNVAAPITIKGSAMALSLDLLVSESVQFDTCPSIGSTYSFTPTFNLTPVTLSPQPTNVTNGKLTGLAGLIASVDSAGGGFTVMVADGPVWSVNVSGSTAFEGVGGASSLTAGMPVNMDVEIQQDGSFLATRVEVDDTNTTNLTVTTGPLEFVTASEPVAYHWGQLEQGYLYNGGSVLGSEYFSYYSSIAVFQTSSQPANLQSLPFSASFAEGNMVPGQNISVTTHTLSDQGGPLYDPATTVTLLPQTIDGTVSAVSSEGGFTVYTVALAAYDLFPDLAVQTGQTTLLTNPGTVVVYTDANTQMLNSEAIGLGSIMRFNGLVFNDNGTLRLDCAQVNDGVPE
jgi:hypothetical protein